ncbi:MAG TPA: hypothetical protein VHU91_04125 [Mycobacteriales bacterium]|jgi:hypothetical protein|nr:hypothetical protein [Mycobacteriales bacterium]
MQNLTANHVDSVDESIDQLFLWHTFDVRSLLPFGWQEKLLGLVTQRARAKSLTPTSITSRESEDVKEISVLTVGGRVLAQEALWLVHLYETSFRSLGERAIGERLFTAKDERVKVNLNLQSGNTMRYEAHVGSNPLEGLLYVTDHSSETDGELVVAQRPDAVGVEDIDKDAAILYPTAGHLVLFDARRYPHYVCPLRSPDMARAVATMTYYTADSPETHRPADLNMHLFGEA